MSSARAGRLSVSGQFLMFGVVVLVAGMVTIGLWVQREIRQVFIARTAEVTASFVDSFVAHHLDALETDTALDATATAELDEHLNETALGRELLTVKIWTRDGTIAYSTTESLVGRNFPIGEDLRRALDGRVVSRISDLSDPGHELESRIADTLIETYVPIQGAGAGPVAAAEFYQLPDSLLADIRDAQLRGWLIVASATVAMYLMLVGLARRAGHLIKTQRAELEGNVARLSGLLEQNTRLQERIRGAAGRATALNEEYLHRISADLHDGPAQNVALAKLRAENLAAAGSASGTDPRELDTITSALDAALGDIRSIAAGLRSPEIDTLSPEAAAHRVIGSFERTTRTEVDVSLNGVPDEAPLPVKITMYRIIQEALSNSFRHAPGATRCVTMTARDGALFLDVADDGPGFDTAAAPNDGSLGLKGMRERVEMLGGRFDLLSARGEGTRIRVSLPFEGSPDA